MCVLSFHSVNSVFCRTKVANFNKVQLNSFSFMDHTFGVVVKTHYQNQVYLDFLLFILLEVLHCTFRSMIYELVFVKGVRSLCSLFSFCIWVPISLALFFEKTALSPLNSFCFFVVVLARIFVVETR